MSSLRLLIVALSAAAGCACGGTRSLEGSLTELLPLQYQQAEVEVADDRLALRFLRPESCGSGLVCQEKVCVPAGCVGDACTGTLACTGSSDVVFQLTVDVADIELQPNLELVLTEEAPRGGQRAVASRNVIDDPRKSFPALDAGRLYLAQAPEPGARVSGDFSITFVRGIEYANGRTVFSRFEASVP